MSAIIAEKQIIVKAIDKVTEPLALMDQRLNNLVQKYDALSQKMQAGVSGQQAFKASLNEVKASASETAEATAKLDHTINGLHDKRVKVNADTTEASSKTERLNSVIKKLAKDSPTITPKVNDDEAEGKLTLLQRTTGRVERSGRSMAKSFVIGGLITSGIQSAAVSLEGFAKQGFQAAQAGALVANRWKSLGMTTGEIKATGAAVTDLKENTGMTGTAVGDLVTRFYGLTGSAKQAIALSKGVGSITDSLRLSGAQADAFANGLTRIEASGKVTRQSLGRLERQTPGLTAALQKASGMSKQSFDDLLNSGKMTADQFNQILERASKSYRENADSWDNTTQGALNNIKQTWANSWKTMMAPLAQSSGQGLGALSKSLQELQPEFKQLGESIADIATKFAKWLTPQHAKDLGEIVGSLGRMAAVLGKGAWEAVTKPLELIGRAINAMSGKKGDALDNIATALDRISKNKIAMGVLEGIGAILATQFAYSKLFKIADGLGLVSKDILSIGKMKFTGNIFKDIFKGAESLKKIKIDPANWFKGGKFSFKNLFKGASKDAADSGDKAGGSFVARLFSKVKGAKVEGLGRGLGSKLGGAFALAFGAIDLFKALSAKKDKAAKVGKSLGETAGGMGGAAIGASLGSVVPGIGTLIGGLLGGIIGSKAGGMIGQAIGKCWGKIKKGATAVGKFLLNALTAPFKAAFKVGEWFGDKVKSILHLGSRKSSKQPSSKEIKSLGGNHYSKTDIANIKEMNRAVEAYIKTLRNLKSTIKKNDPTKELNSMNKSLKLSAKYWLAVSKPVKQASKSFQGMRKPLETISRAMKGLTGKKSGLGAFDKDLTKLGKDLQHSKIGQEFTKLSKEIKKSNLVKTLQKLTKEIRDSVKYWKEFAKPVKQATTEFAKFSKELKPFNGKSNPLDRLEKSVESLTKSLKKNRFGNELAKQMQIANKSMSGRGSVESKFTSMTRAIERDLSRFRSSFNRDWRRTWDTLSEDPSRSLGHVQSVTSSRFNAIVGHEQSFSSKFLSGWRSWNDSVVSEMHSAFDKLPDIAHRAMSDIVSRLNSGISAINGVISDFGGDKKLSTIHYARGTFAHPGGKAVVNDGPEPNKTELIWQPSKGWGTAQGQNVVRDLEPGTMVLDAKRSQPYLGQGILPHYANGTLSDDEQDQISKEFISNPIQASKNLVLKLTNWKSNVPAIADLGEATAVGFSRGIANVLKDLLGIIKEPVHGDWTPVIKSAARLMHVSLSEGQIGKLLRQIQTESGGNEKIPQQISDVNSAAGHPAQGLLQFIPSTFNSWALPGHHNILSGFDQIMAAINALNHGGEGGWGNIGNGHGWASGVHMTHPDLALIGDNAEHDEYVINPYNSQSVPLMRDAWRTMESVHPELRSTSAGTMFSVQVVELLKEAVNTIKNIDLQPVLPVDETRRMINKQNATDWRMAMKG